MRKKITEVYSCIYGRSWTGRDKTLLFYLKVQHKTVKSLVKIKEILVIKNEISIMRLRNKGNENCN